MCPSAAGPGLPLALGSRARKDRLSPSLGGGGVGGGGKVGGREEVGTTWKGLGLGFRDKDLRMFAGWECEVVVNRLVEKPQTPASEDS